MVADAHCRDIQSARTGGASPPEQFREFLAEKDATLRSTERRQESADACEEVATKRNVGTKRHPLPLFEDEGVGSIIHDRDRSPQVARPVGKPRWRRRFP
jgi:hypothetical protein